MNPSPEQSPGPPLPLYQASPHPCPYLPDRTAVNEFTVVRSVEPTVYQSLMDAGFRRSADVIYRPICDGCRECIPIRVPVDRFVPSRSQRRVRRKNLDVEMTLGPPACTDEKWRIFAAYLQHQHDGAMGDSREELEGFLYQSPTSTQEMVYRIDDAVVAVGLVDVTPAALSSVYFYFDPAHARRSLGILGALCEIDECRRRALPYWYIGYYIHECGRMNYKASFRPCELLHPDGAWRPMD